MNVAEREAERERDKDKEKEMERQRQKSQRVETGWQGKKHNFKYFCKSLQSERKKQRERETLLFWNDCGLDLKQLLC